MKIKGIVKTVTGPKEFQGDLQVGFMLIDNDKWFNICADENNLRRIKETILRKGNEIEFEFDELDKLTSGFIVLTEAKEEKTEKKTDSKEGLEDDIINFKDLLNAAHAKEQDFSIKTEIITIDLEKKYALFKARVITEDQVVGDLKVPGHVFEAHGDATADNVKGDFIKPHFIRMAETRAIARALRWYTNNATCAEEEK